MKPLHMPWRTCLSVLVAMWLAVPAWASPWRVTIDSTPIVGQAGYLAFDFIAGSLGSPNTAIVSGFASDATLGADSRSGSAVGGLVPGPLTMGGGPFFNELLQGVGVFGSSISFDVDLGTDTSGAVPDSFSFFLLDARQLPFATSDPTGAGSLFYFDLTGANTGPVVFDSVFASVTVEPLSTPPGLPEPGTLMLVLVATLGAAAAARARPRAQ